VKRDLSRKAEPVGCESVFRDYQETGRERRHTFHDASLVDGEFKPFFVDLDVCFFGEVDAAEEEVQLARGARHSCENWRLILVVHCECYE
jgi:hypothetical protein